MDGSVRGRLTEFAARHHSGVAWHSGLSTRPASRTAQEKRERTTGDYDFFRFVAAAAFFPAASVFFPADAWPDFRFDSDKPAAEPAGVPSAKMRSQPSVNFRLAPVCTV